VTAALSDGSPVDLIGLAEEICRIYREEFPDEEGRYGSAGVAWCVHDNQHILNWAAMSLTHHLDLERQLAWLAQVLEARDFPLDRLARDLDIAAEVVTARLGERGAALQSRLNGGASFIRSKPSFLAGN
jgi:hypothetical protein